MAKPKKTQDHSGTSPPHTRKMYASEDEDICPVCEVECTCNVTESVTAYSFEEFNRQQQQSKAAYSSAASSSKITSALPKGFRPSSSKGLGSASYATVVTSPSPASKVPPRLQSLKLKIPTQSKHDPDHTLSDSSNSTIDAPSGPQLARFNISKHTNGGGSGSITPRHALDDRISPTNGHSGKAVPPKVIAKSKGKGKQPIDRKPASSTKKAATAAATIKKPTAGNPKKPTLVNSKRKLGRPHKKRVRETTSESSLSDFDDFDEDDFVPLRSSRPIHKKGMSVEPETGFPTFVSASVFGDSAEENGSSSSSESETTGLGLSGDSELEEEEERMIVAEEKKERQRKFKELIMNTSHKNHMGGGAGGQQWQIKPRRKSVEGEESVDDETNSESGVGEEEEEEDEDDPDEEDADGEEQAAAWSTDDSDEDLFFANLSDSSISFSADQDDDDDSETVSSTADLAEAASAGFLSGMGMPMVVMDDFGMEFGLGGVLNATDLDQEFEQRARAQLAEEKRTPGRETASPELDVFSTVDYTREALEAVDGLEMDLDSDATEYEEDSDMDGDTTADEMERGRTPARFRFPTPPSINPLSTFSPSPALSPVGWRDFTPTHFTPPLFMRGAAPITPHARAASFGGFGGLDAARARTISASAILVNGSDGSASASEVGSTRPVMGSFGRTGDRRRAAIIDGNAAVPSPFAARRRRRSDSWKSGRKHFGSKSDIFPMLARRARGNSNATSASARSSFHFPTTETELDMDMDMDMEESCTEPFGLDDVLDFSNVSDDHALHHPSHVGGPTDEDEAHLRSLDRWDRVPMGTFRRTRETHDAGSVPNVSTSDGFSYGASSRGSWKGGVLWGGGLSVLGEGKEMLGPVGTGDNLGNSEDVAAAGQFEKAMSRKERRHRKKREAASTHVPTKSFITPPPSPPSAFQTTSTASPSSSNQNRRKDKGKNKQIDDPRPAKRPRRSAPAAPTTSNGISINEPKRDSKGKKRAAPDPDSDDPATSAKKHKSPYALRNRTSLPNLKSTTTMTRKNRATRKSTGKSTTDDEALDLAGDSRPEEDHPEGSQKDKAPERNESDDDDEEDSDEDDEDNNGEPNSSGPGNQSGLDDSAVSALFSADFRALGSYMLSLSSRLKTILNNIKPSAGPTVRLMALQELSEILSMSTEDTLAGYFQVDSFVGELVRIMGGKDTGGDDDDDEGINEDDEDASLAAALALSAGGFPGDDNLEAQVLACRCLANLMEALPGCAHTVVYHGAVPVLCSKLIDIQYIDLAEQTLSTLEKISEEYPSAIVREGGLAALLNFLDFFSTNVQRTALQAAANCCRNVSVDNYNMVKDVFPIIRTVLGYADPRLVEHASLCVIRTIESFRSHPELLEGLVDPALLRALMSAAVSPGTFTLVLRALSSATKSSPKIALSLLEADVAGTLYQILTGIAPPADPTDPCGGADAIAAAAALTDMAVMQNLAHRPKDQVEEALSLVSELMPPLPRDGVFDHRAYSEKALARMVKAKIKALKSARPNSNAGPSTTANLEPMDITPDDPGTATPVAPGSATPVARPGSPVHVITPPLVPGSPVIRPVSPGAQPVPTLSRTELLRSKPDLIGRYMRLMVPVLVDVYAASVATQTRSKSLTGILKAVSFSEGEEINSVLKSVPIATFVGSILSSRDYPALAICALQLVELLLVKAPNIYKPALRREGVLHEIEVLTERPLTTKAKESKTEGSKSETKQEPKAEASSPVPEPASERDESPRPVIPISVKRSSSAVLDPQDAITLRAKVVRFKYLSGAEESATDPVFERLRGLMGTLRDSGAAEAELKDALKDIASMFGTGGGASISSYELLKSGLVDGLLQFTTDPALALDVTTRQQMVVQAFTPRSSKGTDSPSGSPLAVLVKKLQESLTRIENFEVVTVSPGAEASRRNSPSMLARQLRLRIVAEEGTDAPRSCSNIVVSIHAIATFQALNDYLRPRVAGALAGMGAGGSRLSGVLAAFAAAAGLPAGALSRVAAGSGGAGPSSGAAAGSSSGSTSAPTIGRRRSQRLKAKDSAATDEGNTSPTTETSPTAEMSSSNPLPPAASSSAAAAAESMLAALAAGGDPGLPLLGSEDFDMEHTEDMLNEDLEAEFYEEDMEPQQGSPDKTVSVSLNDDGTKVEAQTPDGTRVATPNPAAAERQTPTSSSSSKFSYAAALKAKPTDWHLEFSMDGHILPLDTTIYGAVHNHEARRAAASGSTSGSNVASLSAPSLWQGVYTVKYRKVPGPPPTQPTARVETISTSESTLSADLPHTQILRLLRVLHKMNLMVKDKIFTDASATVVPESAFINNKLTAKLTRQLEEPMIVASQCLPDWAIELPQQYHFLFPFSTRFSFLQSTSFGYARLITKWQSQQQRTSDSSRRDDAFGYLGRLQRQKVRISRHHILESAVKVLELYGSSSSVLEVEYFEEVGTGLGPTLEFYSLVSKEFARRELKMWRDADPSVEGPYVQRPLGLFPAPDIKPEAKLTKLWSILGQFVGKALLDSRIIDLSFNALFLKYILNEEIPLTIASLKLVDPALANSLSKLQAYGVARREIENNASMSPSEKEAALSDLTIHGAHLEDLALDFTVPGYDIELKPGGRDIPVTESNVEEYVREVIDVVIGRGVQNQVQAFRAGFSKVFAVTDLQSFSSEELDLLFGNADEDWSTETLTDALKADHGFNADSGAIRDLITIMGSYDEPTRRAFLQFITGSPKLPIGGFRGLSPQLTVVRKPHEPPLKADDYLPSVMTCVNYLKLPEYSTRSVMEARLKTAMMEGGGSFHLS
ncbi:hypothetical protein OPQ81_007668 [Rhizoctonia solani]|nr:hypothetical protein OPQ81_007668 [Rhizoctonia solani]